ncbi:MAG: SDR family NAD(P)-dependent oxidoreductase [Anaerolineales bacterium]|nr:SDR family NAD(P)-dependent oxidoreductase [Anaerolineales bacterium]
MGRSLHGKVVLITGASSGFGADAALLFAQQGCAVVVAARRMERLQALAGEIQAAGGEALAVPVDVNNRTEIEIMVQTVLEVYGRIDILFNNAGFGRLAWLEELDPERDIETQLGVNLCGLIQVTRAVLPHMYRQRAGHIINMSSVAGLIAAPLYTIYAASKYGVRGFTDALRREAAPYGVQVSGIYPGPAKTEFGHHTGDNVVKRSLKLPGFLQMTSAQVARRTVRLARFPRRKVVIPWYYRIVIGFEALFPGLVDWFLKVAFVDRLHRPD